MATRTNQRKTSRRGAAALPRNLARLASTLREQGEALARVEAEPTGADLPDLTDLVEVELDGADLYQDGETLALDALDKIARRLGRLEALARVSANRLR